MADSNDTLQTLAAQVQELRATIAQQQDTIARQDAQVSALQARLAAVEAAKPTGRMADAPEPRPAKTSRRRLLTTAGAAAAAVAAGVLVAEGGTGTAHAASAHADAITLHETATGTGNIAIQGDGFSGAEGVVGTSDSNVGVRGDSTNGSGVVGRSVTSFGVNGVSTDGDGVTGSSINGPGVVGLSTNGPGVVGQTEHGQAMIGTSTNSDGVTGFSTNGSGVVGDSAVGLGGFFAGGQAPIRLRPSNGAGAPTTGVHAQGDIWVDSAGTLWVCIADGTPGTWVRLTRVANGATGGATTYLAAPIRLLDARSGATSGLINRGPLGNLEIYALQVAGLSGSGIPAAALGLICNVTVLGPSQNGNLSLFPAGAAIPTTASMTFVAGAFLANHVSAALGSGGANQGKVNIQNQSGGNTPLVVDAVGFIM